MKNSSHDRETARETAPETTVPNFLYTWILLLTVLLIGSLSSGCAPAKVTVHRNGTAAALPQVGTPDDDGAVVKGRAIYTVDNERSTALHRFIYGLARPSAYAASGSTPITYTNAGSTNFAINVANFQPGDYTGSTLSLGSVALSNLNDNSLKVCGTQGNTKCTKAAIRVYTTGSVAGFVNTSDLYGAPVYAGTLNPSQTVGLNAVGSVQVQTLTIPSSKNTVKLSDFPSPTYSVNADFGNAGSGSYAMTFVVEYVLLP